MWQALWLNKMDLNIGIGKPQKGPLQNAYACFFYSIKHLYRLLVLSSATTKISMITILSRERASGGNPFDP